MDLCDRCLGRRLVGAAGLEAQTQAARAEREGIGRPEVPPAMCSVCEGSFEEHAAWEQVALAALAGREFTTFQVGTRFPLACEQREKEAATGRGQEVGESVRTEANRLLARHIVEATGATTDAEGRPDVVVHVDTRFWTGHARGNSVFVAGRYTKHRRDLPQTHWPCKTCEGRGCYACDDSGVMYASSVEDVIAGVLVPAFEAEGASFHGAGREDIDALMLGSGRPFVLELHDPKRRTADETLLTALAARVNEQTGQSGVGVQGLRLTRKEEVAALKAGEYDKAYLAHCECEGDVTGSEVAAAAAALSGQTLEQRTPDRVSHRRADLVRKRTVHEVRMEHCADARHFSLHVLAESGTYIKEFVSGDEGRTVPSFSQRLGIPCRVVALDVLGIVD